MSKIAHIVLSLQPGGLERLICNLVKSHELKTIPAVVCCIDETGVLAADIESSGGKVILIKRKSGFDIGLIFRLARFFKKEGITIVHTHSLDPMFYSGFASWLAGVKNRIHTQHNTMLKDYDLKDRIKFRIASFFFDVTVAVSEETHRALLPYGIASDRRTTILNGVDIDHFSKTSPAITRLDIRSSLSIQPDDLVIGTVARLSREKGLDHLLEAFSKLGLSHRRHRLLTVGEGPERIKLETFAEKLGIRSEVFFLGYRENVENLLPAFDLFVLPSLTEGIPLALLEAMSARLPIVATAVGGVPEVIVRNESGILVRPGDPDALRDAIIGLINHPEEMDRLALNAEQRVRKHFSLAAMARAYRQLYMEGKSEQGLNRIVKERVLQKLPRRWMLWAGKRDSDEIALTFDDGPDPEYTPQILDTLRQYDVKATFFVIGEKVLKDKKVMERIVQEGHEIGNHSFTHRDFDRLPWEEALEEINRTKTAIEAFGGRDCRIFRPPRGKLCLSSVLGAWLRGMMVIMWSVDFKDFRISDHEEVKETLVKRPLRAGDIILYHGNNPAALKALPYLVESALQGGLKTVSISQMLSH